MPTSERDKPGPRSKVQRIISEYGLDDLGDELVDRWTAESPEDRSSLRDLATTVNTRLLGVVLEEAGATPLDGEVENIYHLLTDDDVSPADRTRAERRLERHGIDLDTLRSEFVSYQAVRSYLTEYRGVEYPGGESGERLETVTEQLEQLRGRLITVTESKLDQLEANGELDLGDHRVAVEIHVACDDCNEQYTVDSLLERRSCNCNS